MRDRATTATAGRCHRTQHGMIASPTPAPTGSLTSGATVASWCWLACWKPAGQPRARARSHPVTIRTRLLKVSAMTRLPAPSTATAPGEEQLSRPVDGLSSLGLLEFDAVLGEPGQQVMAPGADKAASGEPGVVGDLGDRRRRREE